MLLNTTFFLFLLLRPTVQAVYNSDTCASFILLRSVRHPVVSNKIVSQMCLPEETEEKVFLVFSMGLHDVAEPFPFQIVVPPAIHTLPRVGCDDFGVGLGHGFGDDAISIIKRTPHHGLEQTRIEI